jgi:hypothetical protein
VLDDDDDRDESDDSCVVANFACALSPTVVNRRAADRHPFAQNCAVG